MKTLVLMIVSLALPVSSFAEDWPQWMGPGRNNIWRETGIVEKFPAGGPEKLWSVPVAGGYSGPAVAGGKVFVTDYVTADNVKVANFERGEFSGTERVLCLAEATGDIIWKHEYPVRYSISYPAGPRCTPLIKDGLVYTLGAEGHLICFEVGTGKIVWQVHLPEKYQAKTPLWGYAAHPQIIGNKLITLAGGAGSLCVALDVKTGQEIWRTLTSREQGYAPPKLIEQAGVQQLLILYPSGLSAVNPENGHVYWTVEYGADNGSIIMTPIVHKNLVYVAGYNNKNLLVELDPQKPAAVEVWRDLPRTAVSPVNVQPFPAGDVLYGFDQSGTLHCMEVATGDRIWGTNEPLSSQRPVGSGTAFIVKNGERFILFNELGELILARLSKEKYEEIDRVKVIEPSNLAFGRDVVWSAPAYANRKAFIRNDNQLICLDLAD